VLNHVRECRVFAKEILAHVRATLDAVLLILPVYHLVHGLNQEAARVLCQQGIPLTAPNDLDHIPARAPEGRFQLLDDLTIATHWPIEALEVTIHHKNEIVQILPRSQGDRT